MAAFANRNDAAALLLQIVLMAYQSKAKGRCGSSLDALPDLYVKGVWRLGSVTPREFVAAMTSGVGIRLLC